MKIAFQNELDAETVLIDAALGWETEFPASNVRNPRLSVVGKVTSGSTTPFVRFIFPAAYEPKAFVIANHDLVTSPAITNVQLIGSATDSGADVVYTFLAAGIPSGSMLIDLDSETPTSGTPGAYQYWSVYANKSVAVQKQIGRIYLGTYLETSDLADPDYDGVTQTVRDFSVADRSIGGQEYTEKKTQTREWDVSISLIPETDMANILAGYRAIGKATPFFIKISETSPLNEILYVRFTNDLAEKVEAFDSEFHWNTSMTLREFL